MTPQADLCNLNAINKIDIHDPVSLKKDTMHKIIAPAGLVLVLVFISCRVRQERNNATKLLDSEDMVSSRYLEDGNVLVTCKDGLGSYQEICDGNKNQVVPCMADRFSQATVLGPKNTFVAAETEFPSGNKCKFKSGTVLALQPSRRASFARKQVGLLGNRIVVSLSEKITNANCSKPVTAQSAVLFGRNDINLEARNDSDLNFNSVYGCKLVGPVHSER